MSEVYDKKDLTAILEEIANGYKMRAKAENDLLGLQISNAQKLQALALENVNKQARYKEQQEHAINERLIKLGFDAASVTSKKSLEERLKALDTYYKAEIAKADAATKAKLEKEYKERQEKEKELEKAREKATKKQQQEESKRLVSSTQQQLAGLKVFDFQGLKEVMDDFTEKIKEETGEDVTKGDKAKLMLASTISALGNFTKQFESLIRDIAYAQSEIDTRLQGSSNKTTIGSYWKYFNADIVRYVGMSPFIKQSDVVNNLKTLVGQGIAFNVEQRAFLDTISDKIATTFEATDATLLKLVRIQQADSTAARLGMESALTAFLNNMYETTEYMQSAASSIRASLYEAQALMGATEATAFEFQVQKWLGSLSSVGFGNTEGLAGALGKLAAGDVSAINDGGYGNLLVMAANRAGLSIADILADGLDDSDTNRLMQAMVEYLGGIYAETKNSKVVQQQFANVFGLTASDLKAAANLFGSTNTIGGTNIDYGGMMERLQGMADSMGVRMGMGEMLENLMDNFKFATSSSIGNNPVLYSIFTLGNILKDTTGGIDVPLPLVMGNGLNAKLNVADLMLATSLSGGFLEGLGKMLFGLGSNGSGSAMLRGFGVDMTSIKTLSRGSGTGIGAMSGTTISESGFIGNANAGDTKQKTLQDAEDEGNQKVEAAGDNYTETKLSTVDEHIVDIYKLLNDVVTGASSLKVDMGDANAWITNIRLGNTI